MRVIPTGGGGSGSSGTGTTVLGSTPGLKLSLTTGVPTTTADVTAASTLYYTPDANGNVATYDSSIWTVHTTAEVSLALSGLTSGKNYDVFAYWTGSAIALELLIWTNDTTQVALASQDGVQVRASDHSRLYVGTIRTTSTTTTEDSFAKRFVWNKYNQKRRFTKGPKETANSWTVTGGAGFAQANANAANQFEYVTGDAAMPVAAKVIAFSFAAGTSDFAAGIGIDSTSVNSADGFGNNSPAGTVEQLTGTYVGYPGTGYHAIKWIEAAGADTTSYGDVNKPTYYQAGITGEVFG